VFVVLKVHGRHARTARHVRKLSFESYINFITGVDFRLALLWYYTIVTPFFAMDTSNIDAELAEAEKLLQESDERFSTSALFLFFKGRARRLRVSDLKLARLFQIFIFCFSPLLVIPAGGNRVLRASSQRLRPSRNSPALPARNRLVPHDPAGL
jgi:Protein of unknown function (DUF3808)